MNPLQKTLAALVIGGAALTGCAGNQVKDSSVANLEGLKEAIRNVPFTSCDEGTKQCKFLTNNINNAFGRFVRVTYNELNEPESIYTSGGNINEVDYFIDDFNFDGIADKGRIIAKSGVIYEMNPAELQRRYRNDISTVISANK